jgi:hypothetical protein
MVFSPIESIESQFQPIRSPYFVEDPKQIVTDRVLAQIELSGDVTIGQSFGHQLHNAIFSLCQRSWQSGISRLGEGALSHNFEQETQLLTASPNLPLVYNMNALAQQLKRFIPRKYAGSSGSKSFDDRRPVDRIEHYDDIGVWVRASDFSRQIEASRGSFFQLGPNHCNMHVALGEFGANFLRIRCIANDRQPVSAAAQSRGHQLAAHSARVRDKDIHYCLFVSAF